MDHHRVAEALDDLAAEVRREVRGDRPERDGHIGGRLVAHALGERGEADEIGEQECVQPVVLHALWA